MKNQTIDVFNGDADGICALHQFRMACPQETTLITGVKRNINLLAKVADCRDCELTVFDISLDTNRTALETILTPGSGNRALYFDHHYCGEPPISTELSTHINPDPEICTSLIVDQFLEGRYRDWAVVGAFGDNLHSSAKEAAADLRLSSTDLDLLRELGELLNYNGYGKTVEDLYFHPAALYTALKPYLHPLDFMADSELLQQLRRGFHDDMEKAREAAPFEKGPSGRIYRLPDASWSRRVAGVFMNEQARDQKDQAHALLVDNGDGTWLVSLRAPINRRTGADDLCRRFPTGGGRPAAAGINRLPAELTDDFVGAFKEIFLP
ncbi:MAG: acetyltransferase [Proteobacteria bacterium]|nr:acetyltransferase [Pseudomonadota bacterium]MBU1689038.1 acetyltransferase [Pseudomonadota bacterium]